MIGVISVECQAQNPNMPLYPWTAFVNSPSSIRVRNVPKKIGSWCITRVYVSVVYPDGAIKTTQCVLQSNIWVGTVEASTVAGTSENGYTIFADGTDENGNAVTGYILGRGNVTILDDNGTLHPDAKRYYVRVLSAESETHFEGDLYPTESGYVIWQDGEAHLLGTPFEQISAYVDSAISAKADVSALGDYIPYTVDKNGYKTAATVGTRADGSDVGQYSFACGTLNTAGSLDSVAFGFNNVAAGQYATAIGSGNTVSGGISLAVGATNKVLAGYSIALGDNNTLSGSSAIAIGTMNTANGKYGVAIGGKAHADDSGSFVWNGSDKAHVALFPVYYSHGKGTFNVNPAGGLSGFYVGEQSLNDILSAKADLSAIPTKTSQLSNDSGYITAADIIIKRDLNDLNIYADPMAEHTPIEVTVWHNDEISTLYTLNWDGSSWYYTDGGTSIQIYFDDYSSAYIITGSVQDMGGTQRSINGQFDLTSPSWSVTFETQYFYKIEIASVKAHIVTREYVDSRLSALEARIAALEGN